MYWNGKAQMLTHIGVWLGKVSDLPRTEINSKCKKLPSRLSSLPFKTSMSHNPASDSHQYDGYAGQYPPPHQPYPPVANTPPPSTQYYPVYPPEQSQPELTQAYPRYQGMPNTNNPPMYPPYQDSAYHNGYSNDPNAMHVNQPVAISPPQPQSYHTPPPTLGPTSNNNYPNVSSAYSDPHSVPLTNYREPDHEAYAGRHDVDTAALLSSHNNAGVHGHEHQLSQTMQEDEFEEVLDMELQEPKHLVAPASYNRPDRDGFLPGERRRGQKPTAHAANDPESYLPKPYVESRRGGLCHGMSCCSIFCLLISVAFIVAGAVLTIYAKVAKGNCDQALQGNKQVAQPMCDTVLYDALFYGGIAVMILAGITTLWRLFTCMCARGRWMGYVRGVSCFPFIPFIPIACSWSDSPKRCT